MEIVKEIKELCIETDNEWFIEHSFPKIAFNELYRNKEKKSKWIIEKNNEGKIIGFICIKCDGTDVDYKLFTHTIYFALVKPEYRKKGILKSMLSQLPKDWRIWIEVMSGNETVWKKCGYNYYKTISSCFNKHILYSNLPREKDR